MIKIGNALRSEIEKTALSEKAVYKAIANTMKKKHAVEMKDVSKWPSDKIKSFVLNTKQQYDNSIKDVLRLANPTTFTSPFYRDMAKNTIQIVKGK